MSVQDNLKDAAAAAVVDGRELSRGAVITAIADGLVEAVHNNISGILGMQLAGVAPRHRQSNGSGEVATAERLVAYELLTGKRGVELGDREFMMFCAALDEPGPAR